MNGITAIQMDIKIKGIDEAILRQALSQALRWPPAHSGQDARSAAAPREQLSKYAPKIIRFTINPDKIREVIGPGGKMINKIIARHRRQDRHRGRRQRYIATPDEAAAAKATPHHRGHCADIEVGDVYTGKVSA